MFQGLDSCALGSAPWTLLLVSVLVGERCSCVLSVQCHITCLGSAGETCTFQNHPSLFARLSAEIFGAEVSLCFMMLCQCLKMFVGACRGLMSPVSAAFGHICAAEVATGTLLFSAWKLRQRGWISDPCMAATDCEGIVMGLTPLSQVLGSKGQSLGISEGISGGQSDC